jgi:predicted secreted protein
MATTGKFNGTLLNVYLDNVIIGCATSSELSVNVDLADATCKDDGGWADHIHGLRDWSVSTDGLVSYNGTNNIGDLYTLLSGRTSVSLKFTTNVTGDLVFSGTASVASISVSAEMEAAVTYSVEFTGKGPLTKATVTAPST